MFVAWNSGKSKFLKGLAGSMLGGVNDPHRFANALATPENSLEVCLLSAISPAFCVGNGGWKMNETL